MNFNAIKTALASALTRAGFSPASVVVSEFSAQESWRDVDGFKFEGETPALTERAVNWCMAYCRKHKKGNSLQIRPQGVVVVDSWSIGD